MIQYFRLEDIKQEKYIEVKDLKKVDLENFINKINDAEIPAVIYTTIKEIGFEKFKICINNRKILNGLFESLELQNESVEILRIIDKIEKIGEEKVVAEIKELGVADEKIATIMNFIKIDGTNDEKLEALRALNLNSELFMQGLNDLNEVVKYISENEVKTDTMIWAPCVCPMVSTDLFCQGIEVFNKIQLKEIDADSVATAALIKEYLFDEKGPINFSVEHHVPSQLLPNWHYITNGFFIAKTEDMNKWGFVYGPHPYLVEVNKFQAIDIDDEYDFMQAEFVYKCLNKYIKRFKTEKGILLNRVLFYMI